MKAMNFSYILSFLSLLNTDILWSDYTVFCQELYSLGGKGPKEYEHDLTCWKVWLCHFTALEEKEQASSSNLWIKRTEKEQSAN